MNALVLGGMSPRHREWVRQVAEALKPHFEEVSLLDYQHWDSSESEMDLEYEISRAAELCQGLDSYVVVAKSIGTVVATLAISRALLAPEYCVFMGFPLKVVVSEVTEMETALPNLPPTHFIHNEQDPLGSADTVKAYIEAHAPERYDFLVARGGTHDYVDFKLITDLALG